MADVIIKPYNALCELEQFVINGISADYEDFGDKEDIHRESAPEYGCGYMKFLPKDPTDEVIRKYHITLDEYDHICSQLDKALSFGHCGWCI